MSPVAPVSRAGWTQLQRSAGNAAANTVAADHDARPVRARIKPCPSKGPRDVREVFDRDIGAALDAIAAALTELRTDQPTTATLGVLDLYFHATDDKTRQRVIERLDMVHRVLTINRQKGRYGIDTDREPEKSDRGSPLAVAHLNPQGWICFGFNYGLQHGVSQWENVATVAHEAVHLTGVNGTAYQWQEKFKSLTTEQALQNADSFAYLVRDLAIEVDERRWAAAHPSLPTPSPQATSLPVTSPPNLPGPLPAATRDRYPGASYGFEVRSGGGVAVGDSPTWYVRIADVGFRSPRPVVQLLNPVLGMRLALIGERVEPFSEAKTPAQIASTLYAGAEAAVPDRGPDNFTIGFTGGISILNAMDGSGQQAAVEFGVSLGFRWGPLDFQLSNTMIDTTAGESIMTLGTSVNLLPLFFGAGR